MLVILLIFALIRTLRSVPLASVSKPPDLFTALNIRDAQTHFGQRSVNNIVISCLATIFACTWSAVHPNIPAVTDSGWTCFKRRVTITVYALLAPELLAMWAMNQRVGAKKIMNEYNEALGETYLASYAEQNFDQRGSSVFNTVKGWFVAILDAIWGLFHDSPLPKALVASKGPRWTLAHGFFLQMGGFMLCESGVPIRVLVSSDEETGITKNIQDGIIDPPRMSEEDIKDQSKGDAISKTLIVFQTTWFIVQCIARWSQRLPVTELEIVTLGFAMLNGTTYGLWWHKPQNIGRPVFLESKKPQGNSRPTSDDSSAAGDQTPDRDSSPLLPHSKGNPGQQGWMRRELLDWDIPNHFPQVLWYIPMMPLLAIAAFLRPLGKMIGDDKVTKMRVGTFYTAYTDGDETGYTTAAIGALFGAVHLIPSWFLDFPSHQEMWLWRVSVIIITAVPILLGVGNYFVTINQHILGWIFGIPAAIGLPLYPIARIILLTLSLTALRSLPAAALQTIEWTTFIPHL